MGRAEADISHWIEYFCQGMVDSFAQVRAKAETLKDHQDQKPLLRELDQKQKQVLSLFVESRFITTKELSDFLHIHRRTALNVCKKWVEEG